MQRLLLVLALVSAGCGESLATTSVRDTPIQLDEPTVLELLERSQPVVHVTLDGKKGVPFLVDTGASLTLIDLTAAEELGLFVGPYSEGTTARGSGGGSVDYDSYARVGRLEAGGLVLEGARLPALDTDLLRDVELVGILGQDLLARLVVLFDPGRRRLHVLPTETDAEGISAYLGEAEIGVGTWIQADVELRPCPFLPLVVKGVPGAEGELEIDTGAVGTSFPRAVLDGLGLEPIGTTKSRGIDGTFEEPTHELEGFGFYGFSISCQVKRSALEYGLLGMNVLGEFVFLVDGPGSTLWLHHREVKREAGDSSK